ncbi:MAG: hydrogenase maturation protease [Acidobacteriota bacterium]|nr:hydrogenase maturation protease [Acidobacteriota bacterium]
MEALELLQQVLCGQTCLVGIGNKLRGDDGFGPYFIELLRQKSLFPPGNLLTVEDVPENYAFPLSKKEVDNIVFIDAVLLEAPPGAVIFGTLAELEEVSEIVSTHKLSLTLTARLLEKADKKVFLLGIVPETTGFGQELTPGIKKITEQLVALTEQMVNKTFFSASPDVPAIIQFERKKI